ncbi:NAD(P)-dependent oxidoreductase [Sideroxyarcus emersonii]|nr:NAD-dependent epimerase/dehydratase family protein [Sideroxyarcus emersonii]
MIERKAVALVTGATGFVGSHLVRRLVTEGWEVHILNRAESRLPDHPEFAQTTRHIHDGSTQGMAECVAQAKPDVVFHLASLFLAQHESKDIEPLVLSNVLFGSQLLEAMRINGVDKIVNTGTSWQHYNNEDYNPVCLYAATKQAFEDILAYYTEAASLKAVTLQLFDTYGPGDPRPKLFHLLAKTAKNQEALAMSPGEQLIDLVYIDDVIDAFLCAKDVLYELPKGHQVYAVSSGQPLQLRELVAIYENELGVKLPIEWGKRTYRPREVMTPWNKGRTLRGWHPKVGLVEGIRRISR